MINHISLTTSDVDSRSQLWNQAFFRRHLHKHKVCLSNRLHYWVFLVTLRVWPIREEIENSSYFFLLWWSPLGQSPYPLKTTSRILSSSSSLRVNLSFA